MSEDVEGGIGCRVPLQSMMILFGLLVVGSVLFFTADPGAVPFWRLWLFSSFAPVSGVALSFGAGGMAWSLDGVAWILVSVWVGRPNDLRRSKRRLGLVLAMALVLGFAVASAG